MHTWTAAVGDYAHTAPLKTGRYRPDGCRLEFVQVEPIHRAFGPMVRELRYDVCEMALATYLQAREAGRPISLLPVAMSGNFHHHSLARRSDGPVRRPEELAGRRVGVRAYSQTTGLWVRGILSEQFGVGADQVTWVTTEGPHVPEYAEPANVERSRETLPDLLRDGGIAAAVLGLAAIRDGGGPVVPLIEDWPEAEREWFRRHSAVPVNHVLTVRTDLLRSHPDAVRSIHRAFTAAIDAARTGGPPAPRERAVAHGVDDPGFRSSLELAVRYAREQRLIRSGPTPDELFADFTRCLGP